MPPSMGTGGRLYGRESYRPLRIILQMLTLQAVFYASAACACFVAASVSAVAWSPLLLLDAAHATVFTPAGWVSICGLFAAAFATAAALPPVVERAKKAVDFTFTVFFVHGALCAAAAGALPLNATWWLSTAVAFVVAAALGEYLCVRREMSEISVDDILRRRKPAAPSGAGVGASAAAAVSVAAGESRAIGSAAPLPPLLKIVTTDDDGACGSSGVGGAMGSGGAASVGGASLGGSGGGGGGAGGAVPSDGATARGMPSFSPADSPSSVFTSSWLRTVGPDGGSVAARGPFGSIVWSATPQKAGRGGSGSGDSVAFDSLQTATVGLTRRATAAGPLLDAGKGGVIGGGGGGGGGGELAGDATAAAAREEAPFLTPRGKSKARTGWGAFGGVLDALGLVGD